jgi:pyruvate ferredoxin oxidoreductase beta subunit
MQIAKQAVESNFWPLFEVENGRYRINHKPKNREPIEGWLEQQGRFKHLFKPGNESIREAIQTWVDEEWEKLLRLEGEQD